VLEFQTGGRMGKNTSRLDHKEEYIRLHLFNELRWLLGAATEWFIQDRLKLQTVGYDVQVYAMDSAFVHARVLFEFFVQPTSANHYGSDCFLDGVLESNSYTNDWKRPLHAFLMHAQDRSRPARLKSSGVEKDLNQMPVDFACEILKLWEEFEGRLGKAGDQRLQELARVKRKEAIEKAQCVVNSTVAQQHAGERYQLLKPVFVFPG
jgi:hypothetical protein